MNKRTHWLLRVDLSAGVVTRQAISPDWQEQYIGGKTLGLFLALRDGLSTVAPYSAQNKIYLLTGPLTGFASGAGSTAIITKSPLTRTLVDSISQGKLGYALKAAGFDGLIIEGASPYPVYLEITDSRQCIVPAGHLQGMLCSQVYSALRDAHPNIANSSVVAIGPAGENRVRFAATMVDTRAFGRGGSGAVLGSKNVKALIVGGQNFPEAFDPDTIAQQHLELRAYVESGAHPYTAYQHRGTASIYQKHVEHGSMSGKSFGAFEYDDPAMLDLGNAIVRAFDKDPDVCFRCYLSCARSGIIQRGRYFGQKSNGPEFETIWAFGPHCGNNDPQLVIEADLACDELGLDTLSAGHAVSFYLECLNRGLLSSSQKQDEGIVDIIYRIAHRQGDGDLLAEGVQRAAEIIGPRAEPLAMHVKGLELPAYDPRGFMGIALGYAVNKRGGDHRKAFCAEESAYSIDGNLLDGKARMVIEEEHRSAYRDSLVVCKWASAGLIDPYYLDALYGSVGLRMTHADLMRVGCRAVNMAQLFNLAQGYVRDDDTLPERFFDEARLNGPLAGEVVSRQALEKLKDEYYQLRGWTPDGVPTPQTLRELGLDEFRP